MARRNPEKAAFLANPPEGYRHLSPNYAWRIYQGELKGLTRKQARGHAPRERDPLATPHSTKRYTETVHRIYRVSPALMRDSRSIAPLVDRLRQSDSYGVFIRVTDRKTKKQAQSPMQMVDSGTARRLAADFDRLARQNSIPKRDRDMIVEFVVVDSRQAAGGLAA